VRGNALARPAVAGALDGFILTAWHGHRDDADIPAAVRDVWKEKFGPGHPKGSQSNVDVAILDAGGRVVTWFDSLDHSGGRIEMRADRVEAYWLRRMGEAREALKMPPPPKQAARVELPSLERGRTGVRVFAWLEDPGMPAYAAPTVEVVALEDADWDAVRRPEKAVKIGAKTIEKWLKPVYPPGVMERTNPTTKFPFTIARAEGELSFAPAGKAGDVSFALLSGEVTLFDTGGDGFSFKGELTVALAYRTGESRPSKVCGVFDGKYPRTLGANGKREFPMRGAIEILP
jgi:hypothetical protein